MAAPLIAQGLIQKAPEILATKTVEDTVHDVRQVVLTEEGRKGIGNTLSDAAKGAKRGLESAAETVTNVGKSFGPSRFAASLLLGDYKSPKTLEDNAILTAIIEYRKSYTSTHKEDQAEKKFWEVIEKNMKDRSHPVKIDINKAGEALAAAKRMTTEPQIATAAGGGRTVQDSRSVQGGRLEGIIAAAVVGGGEFMRNGSKLNIQTTMMILTAIFLIAIVYITGCTLLGNTTDQKFTKNTIIVSGVLIILLGCLSFTR